MSPGVYRSRGHSTILLLSEHESVWLKESRPGVQSALNAVSDGLTCRGHEVIPLHIRSPQSLPTALKSHDPAKCIVFNWYEGIEWGAGDGAHAAALLDDLGFTYTGADTTALLLTQDKTRMLVLLQANGIPTPAGMPILGNGYCAWDSFPAIVKVATEHGSEFLTAQSVVRDKRSLQRHVSSMLDVNPWRLMVTEFIDGREFAVSLWGNDAIEILPLVEINFSALPQGAPTIRTFESKWAPGSAADGAVRTVCPPRLPRFLQARIEQAALAAYRAFGLRDYARIDIRMRENIPQVIDINPNPDIAVDSSFVMSAAQAGYDYAAMLDRIVRFACQRRSEDA